MLSLRSNHVSSSPLERIRWSGSIENKCLKRKKGFTSPNLSGGHRRKKFFRGAARACGKIHFRPLDSIFVLVWQMVLFIFREKGLYFSPKGIYFFLTEQNLFFPARVCALARLVFSVLVCSRSATLRGACGALLPNAILYRSCGLGQCCTPGTQAGSRSRRVVPTLWGRSDLSRCGLGGGTVGVGARRSDLSRCGLGGCAVGGGARTSDLNRCGLGGGTVEGGASDLNRCGLGGGAVGVGAGRLGLFAGLVRCRVVCGATRVGAGHGYRGLRLRAARAVAACTDDCRGRRCLFRGNAAWGGAGVGTNAQ